MRTNTRTCLGNLLRRTCFFAVTGMVLTQSPPPAAAQQYTAMIGPDLSGGFNEGSLSYECANAPPGYTYFYCPVPAVCPLISPLVGTAIRTPSGSLVGYLLDAQFVQVNGKWRPASVSYSGPSSIVSAPYYATTTLDASGRLNTYLSYAGDDFSGGFFSNTSTETIDLQTGKWTYSSQQFESNPSGWYCGSGVYGELTGNLEYSGTWEITLVPVAAQLSLATLNPYSCAVKGYSCNAVPSSAAVPDEVTSAPAASAISADGHSAAVIVISSNDANDPVEITLTGPSSFSGAIGSLSSYDPNFLSEQPSGTTSLTVASPDYCDEQGNCIFLALLWAPSTMSGGIASPAGGYGPVPLTVTTSQGDSEMQATITLQPPPLVLVHGIWSNASEAWSLFENWLARNYPHSLIFAADYGGVNYLAFSDPQIQNILEGKISDALSSAASKGVVARQVDVVGHSMGGLVTRYFMQNGPPSPQSYLLANPVHKLITIGTPHLGTHLATALATYQGNEVGGVGTGLSDALEIGTICSFKKIQPCTVYEFFKSQGRIIGRGVVSMETPPPDETQYSSIVGLKPESPISTTEQNLNLVIHAFLSDTLSIDTLLGETTSDTIVNEASQTGTATPDNTQLINGIVHAAICGLFNCSDVDETSSSDVFGQAAYWLMGGSGAAAQSSSSMAVRSAAKPGIHALDATPASPPPVLELDGYSQVDASNVSFSPTSDSTLTINSPTDITATSPTKTITEVLLFQTVSDPTDVPLLYSTQSPFTVTFAPTRMGSTNFVAFAVFSDMTFAATSLNYSFQLPGDPLTLTLVNAPVASLPVGASAIVGAQALFSSGPVDVSQAATYKVRSGATSVFSVDSTGTVTANGPGNDWLDVSYNGVSASAQISVGSCTYSLSPVNQLVDYSGGNVTVQVTTQDGCGWTADGGGAGWVTFTSASGTGSGTVTLNAAANTTGNQQTAVVTVANQDAAVTQPGSACSYVLNATTATLPAAGGSGSDGVTTSCPIAPMSDAPWLTAAASTNAIVFSASANTSGASRSATITVGTEQLQVTQASLVGTNTTLAASPNPAVTGQSVTLSATVSTQASGSGTPTGIVIFFDGSTPVGNAALDGSGQAALTTSSLAQGSHLITGSYSGDSNFAPSTSPVLTELVNNAAPVVAVSPGSLTFSNQLIGTPSASQPVTLSNTGTALLTIASITASGDFSRTNNCGTSVAVNGSCTINVTFTPTAPGTRNGSVTINDNASGSPQSVSLTGTGTGPGAGVSPAALTFPALPVNSTSGSQAVTLSNTGNVALNVTSIVTIGDFSQNNNCGSSVAAAGSCTINVTFTPTATGTRSGTLTITDNSNGVAGSTQSVTLSGTGQDFSFALPTGSPTSQTVAPGSTATYTLSVAGLGGFNQSVSFTCTGAPSEATCTVSPNPATAGSSATDITVSVTTTAPSLGVPRARPVPPALPLLLGLRGLLMLALVLALTAWAVGRRNPLGVSRWGSTMIPLAWGLLLALALAGCGGGGGGGGRSTNPGTPAGTYKLTVTGTIGSGSTALSHSVTLTLTVS